MLIEFHIVEIVKAGVGFRLVGFGRTCSDVEGCSRDEFESGGQFAVARAKTRIKWYDIVHNVGLPKHDEGGRGAAHYGHAHFDYPRKWINSHVL